MPLTFLTHKILWVLMCVYAIQPLGVAANDEQLTEARQKGLIEGAFRFNPYIRSAQVRIAVSKNVVTISGYVDSAAAKSLVEQLAMSIKGLKQVHNNLIVAPERLKGSSEQTNIDSRLSNVTITNKVKSQLLANRNTSGMNIEVETNNRVVTVTGQVGNGTEKELAYWIVKNTQGVKSVIDRLDVENSINRQVTVNIAD